jgi:preprotein translocase subunit SecG
VKKTNDFVEKATWTLAIVLLLFSLGSSFISSSTEEELQESIMQEQLENSTTAPEQLAPVGDPGLDPSATPQQNGGSAPMQSTDNPSEE